MRVFHEEIHFNNALQISETKTKGIYKFCKNYFQNGSICVDICAESHPIQVRIDTLEIRFFANSIRYFGLILNFNALPHIAPSAIDQTLHSATGEPL
jgi:ribosomal protein L31